MIIESLAMVFINQFSVKDALKTFTVSLEKI
jgi:hypothetical protein